MAFSAPDADFNKHAADHAALITHLSVHESAPGKTGAGEASGGSPAYARKPVTWGVEGAVGPLGAALQPAVVGRIYSDQATFDVDPATYSHWGGWDAATGGAFHGGDVLAASQVIASQGQLKVWVYLEFRGIAA
jgi:hypothetical protein